MEFVPFHDVERISPIFALSSAHGITRMGASRPSLQDMKQIIKRVHLNKRKIEINKIEINNK